MRLYIIAGRINIDVPDVTLVDGCKPSVGGYRPSTIDFEPAIWFKVMLLDAVTIDCNERRISWVPLYDSSVSNFAELDSGIALCGSYRVMSSAEGDDHRHHLIDFSDDTLCCQLNEAFDVIPDLVERYESNQLVREDFNQQLMQLLHVHVLPSIRLTAQDSDYIVACIHALGAIIEKIDNDILEITEKIRRAEQSLASMRKKIITQLVFSDRKANFDMFSQEFISLLLSKRGIVKDIEVAWVDVERAQSAVDKRREKPYADDAALMIPRAERDHVRAEYDTLLAGREKLKEMQHSKRGIVKRVRDAFASVPEDPQHKIYVGIVSKLTEFEKLNELITHKKLLVTSVKEAARLALNDVQSGSDSFGMDVDFVRAAHSTDVLGGNITASWQSLAEQIGSVLGNNSRQIAKLHRDFCRHVTDVCAATGVEKKLYDESLSRLQHSRHSSSRSSTKPHNSMTHSSSSGSICELQLDLSNSAFCPSDSVSLPGEQNCHLSELSVSGGHDQQESVVKSLPLLNQSLDSSSSSMHSVSAYYPQKVDPKPEAFRINSRRRKRPSLTTSFTSYVPHGLISIYQPDSGRDSPVIVLDADRDCVRIALESLRKEILDHFDKISVQLQQELSASSGRSHYRQVWLDYESHFYQEMMTPLTELYQLQYANITDAFCSSLPELTPSDLSLDEAVLVHLLQGQHEESVCLFESCSPPVESRQMFGAESTSHSVTLSRLTDLQSSQISCGLAKEGQQGVDSDTDDLSRLLRTHSEESRHPRLRTVRISLPVIVEPRSPTSKLVYERTLAPLPSESESFQLSLSATTMILKPYYRKQFASALRHIELAIEARTPGSKLRHLTDCLRETTKQLAAFYAELYGDLSSQSSCDELLDAVVILLCNVDGRQMAMLYCQLTLLADLMAPWLVHGPYSFTLVQFTGACQFIQERLMLKRNRRISTA